MKEILITFGSIVAILWGSILIYVYVLNGYWWEYDHQIGAGCGVLLLAAGITGLWMKGRFKKE